MLLEFEQQMLDGLSSNSKNPTKAPTPTSTPAPAPYPTSLDQYRPSKRRSLFIIRYSSIFFFYFFLAHGDPAPIWRAFFLLVPWRKVVALNSLVSEAPSISILFLGFFLLYVQMYSFAENGVHIMKERETSKDNRNTKWDEMTILTKVKLGWNKDLNLIEVKTSWEPWNFSKIGLARPAGGTTKTLFN